MARRIFWMMLSYGLIYVLTILLFSVMGLNYDFASGSAGYLRGLITLAIGLSIR